MSTVDFALAKASDYFTLMASGFALVSDGYQNNLATVFNAIFVRYSGNRDEVLSPNRESCTRRNTPRSSRLV
jgi:hypothetical protein